MDEWIDFVRFNPPQEEPDAVIPRAGNCEGQLGNWLFYLDLIAKQKDLNRLKAVI